MAKPTPIIPGVCYVCDRPLTKLTNDFGHRRIRHDTCAPGSKPWCEWYDRTGRHTPEGDLIRANAETARAKACEKLKALTKKIKDEKEAGTRV